MPLRSRLATWCIALLLCISLYVKGRVPAEKGGDAAFLRPAPATVTVRLAGDFPRPGVYRFPEGTSPAAAIKMTLPEAAAAAGVNPLSVAILQGGDVVNLKLSSRENAVISITKMEVHERMLLGIPLHPDRLSAEEWSLLPGIGPVLSRRIVDDRHKNGAFGSLEGVLRVRGVGPGKLAEILRYF